MKSSYKIAAPVSALLVMSILSAGLVPEAQALRGRGAAFAVGAAAGSASTSSSDAQVAAAQQQTAAAQQQAAAAQQQAAAAQKEAEAAKQQAAAATAGPLPLGTVVPSLPAGCAKTASGGVTYYQCGPNVYQAVYEGSTLKYVTAKPK